MSGEELQVDPRDLHGKAAQIDALAWPSHAPKSGDPLRAIMNQLWI